MLADPGEDFDQQLKLDLHTLFTRIDHCTNTHFRRGTRSLEDNLETEELLGKTVIVENRDECDADAQLGA